MFRWIKKLYNLKFLISFYNNNSIMLKIHSDGIFFISIKSSNFDNIYQNYENVQIVL